LRPPCGVLRNFAATETPDFPGRLPQLEPAASFGLLFGFIGRGAAVVALCALAACSSAGGLSPLAGASIAKSSFAPEAPKAAQLAAMEAVSAPQPRGSHNGLDGLINHYAAVNGIPVTLIHRVIDRESDYNPKARNGSYYGLMQISHATAKSMGYTGSAAGLLDPEVNLRYATKYLAGAYLVGGNSEDQAIRNYSRGYYYDAKRQGLLEEVGLR
jgi:soluble lytic murein transglycosylase-like protein